MVSKGSKISSVQNAVSWQFKQFYIYNMPTSFSVFSCGMAKPQSSIAFSGNNFIHKTM